MNRLSLNQDDLAHLCRRHGIRRLSLFGSVLRGTDRPDSDVDLLVEFEPDRTPGLMGMASIEDELSALLGGRRVDLRTAADLSRYFRDEVTRTAEQSALFESGGRTSMDRARIDDAVDCLAHAAPDGSSVILFGSHARGDARHDSDMDLLVIEPEVHDVAAETIRLSILLGRRLIPADVVVMSRDAFERQRKVPNTLAYRAAREGRMHELVR